MGDSIEQAKQEVLELLPPVQAIRDTLMANFQKVPGADTLEYWVNIRDSMLKQANAQANAGKTNEERSDKGFETKLSGDGKSIIITKYIGSDTEVNIPAQIDGKPVIGIGERAFSHCEAASITLPDTIVFIEERGLAYGKYTSIKIPDSVKVIGEEAFARSQFTEITIPGSVETIGRLAFERGKLVKVIIGDGVKTIDEGAFQYNEITSIVFGGTVETIKGNAFRNNKLAGVLTIPENVKDIDSRAFDENPLEAAVIPDSDITVHYSAFGKVKAKKASDHAFESGNAQYTKPEEFKWRKTKDGKGIIIDKYTGKGPDVNIPPQIQGLPVVEITQMHVKTITSITIPGTIKSLSPAFAGNELTSVIISEGVTVITDSAFKKNKKLTEVVIPDSVITIEKYAFEECGLTSVTLGKNVKSIGRNAFQKNQLAGITLPDGLRSIENGAFSNNQLTEITIPDTVANLGQHAFSNNKLKSVTIPKGVTCISRGMFMDNPLTSVTLHNQVMAIEDRAFCDCKLAGLTIPETVKHIGKQAFMNCKIKSLIIPDSVTTIEQGAFYWNSLKSLEIGKGITNFESMTFTDNNLTEVIIPSYSGSGGSAFGVTDEGVRAGKTQPNVIRADGPKKDPTAPPSYPPRPDFLRELDMALNCSISPKESASEPAPKKITPRKEDVLGCYGNDWEHREIHPTGNKLWERQLLKKNNSAAIIGWKNKDAAKEGLDAYQTKNPKTKCTRIGTITCFGEAKPFKRAALIMDMPKDEVMIAYTHIGVGSQRTIYMIKEVKPAGNWLWEFEVADEKSFGVIIGWASMADADRAENTYKSMPEIQYRRHGNAIGFSRGSADKGLSSCTSVLGPFGSAAYGRYSKDWKDDYD